MDYSIVASGDSPEQALGTLQLMVDDYLVPAFGDLPLEAMTPEVIDRWRHAIASLTDSRPRVRVVVPLVVAARTRACRIPRMSDRATRGMAAIGGAVAVASALSPQVFLRAFGIAPTDVTGAAAFGWRLFAVRTAYISGLAMRGDSTARDAFLPIQVLDQLVFWHAFKTRSVPKRAVLLASATSGAIITLDLLRRRS